MATGAAGEDAVVDEEVAVRDAQVEPTEATWMLASLDEDSPLRWFSRVADAFSYEAFRHVHDLDSESSHRHVASHYLRRAADRAVHRMCFGDYELAYYQEYLRAEWKAVRRLPPRARERAVRRIVALRVTDIRYDEEKGLYECSFCCSDELRRWLVVPATAKSTWLLRKDHEHSVR